MGGAVECWLVCLFRTQPNLDNGEQPTKHTAFPARSDPMGGSPLSTNAVKETIIKKEKKSESGYYLPKPFFFSLGPGDRRRVRRWASRHW